MIERAGIDQIKELARFFPAIALVGARQTGKTTLVQALFPDYSYVSLDVPSQAALAEHDPDAFFALHPAPIIIDEVQYAPGLFRHLKVQIDAARHEMGRYILTGSQKFGLMKSLSDSLAGRVGIVSLEGLSFAELQAAQLGELRPWLHRGGYPELWRLPDFPARQFFASYLATYLERDVRQLLNVGDLRDFERFIRVLAQRHGQQLDYAAIANGIGVGARTVKAWVSVLEASNQIFLLEPWYGNLGKRILKKPKVYFADSGLVCWLLGIEAESLDQSPFVGPIWEGAVFAELRRQASALGLNRTFYYYRDNEGTEVDFLVLGGGARFIEVKWTQYPAASDARSVKKLAKLTQGGSSPELRDPTLWILCRTEQAYPLEAGASVTAASVTGDSVTAAGLSSVGKILTS
ncbi:MAG: ATP-binding protein [Spirochaeta sp.]|nr:ATP-binding protein [Spirochaeta sp.]